MKHFSLNKTNTICFACLHAKKIAPIETNGLSSKKEKNRYRKL